ncbi:MAG: hypothetical protein HOC71_05520 [Candidatus Latescibacteria bacterium]|jgi:hypothetical protein|nr:hypothetical protein [Candidatus Latescibacterota bacterium]
MKNQKHTNQLKWILEEGMHKIPSEDFNTRIIEKVLSEREMIILKPGINYSLLLISAAMILLLSGLILYVHAPSMNIIPFISDIDNIIEKLYIALFAVTAFSIFTILTDVLENRGVLIKVF